jgi:hypothetical protein
MRTPGSRALRFRTCTGSLTARGPLTARDSTIRDVAFRLFRQRRHPEELDFAAQWLACTYRYRRFATSLRVVDARLTVIVGRYSFGVRLFYPHLNAGLSRRFPKHQRQSFKGRATSRLVHTYPTWQVKLFNIANALKTCHRSAIMPGSLKL